MITTTDIAVQVPRPSLSKLLVLGASCLALSFAGHAAAQDTPSDVDSSVMASSSGAVAGEHGVENEEGLELSPKEWAGRIASLLPTGSTGTLLADPVSQELDSLSTPELRRIAQDVLSERINIDRDRVLSAYMESARRQAMPMDAQLADLYSITGRAGSRQDFTPLEAFYASRFWYVAVSAHVELARHLSFSNPEGAQNAIEQALLNIPDDAEADLAGEAYYNIAIVAQNLAMHASDLETAFAASQSLLKLAVEHERLIDRHTLVFNLAQLHGATFDFQDTSHITERLLAHSLELDDKRAMLGLSFHGAVLFETGEVSEAIPYLKRARRLAEAEGDPFYEVYTLQYLVRALAGDGQTSEAQEAFARLQSFGDIESSVRSLLAKASLKAALGDSAEAYDLQVAASRRILSAYSKSLLLPRPVLRLDVAFESERPTLAPALGLDLAGMGQQRLPSSNPGATQGLSEAAFRDLRALEVELALLPNSGVEPFSDENSRRSVPKPSSYSAATYGPWQDVLDAAFERGASGTREAVANYRAWVKANLQGSESGDADARAIGVGMLELFEDYQIKNEAGGRLDPLSETEAPHLVRGVNRLLESRLALAQGRMEDSYLALETARQIADTSSKLKAALTYDISGQDLVLAAMEANPALALRAALDHTRSAVEEGRSDPLLSTLTGAVAALEGIGQIDLALDLADSFVAQSRTRDAHVRSVAAYTKGRLLYQSGQYDRAVLFLLDARNDMQDSTLEPLILQTLYASLAGAGDSDRAFRVGKQLRLSLTRINEPVLSDAAVPYMAHANALLRSNGASAGNSAADFEAVSTAWKSWAELDATTQRRRRQHQAQMAVLRASAAADVLAERALAQSEAANAVAAEQARATLFTRGSVLLAVLMMLGLGGIAFQARRYRRQQIKSRRSADVKGQFLNMIGHEARIRLQGITSFADSLKAASISLEHLPTVQVIGKQADALSRSISDLVASARILSGDTPARSDLFIAEDLRRRMLKAAPELIGKRDVTLSFDIAGNVTPMLVERDYVETVVERLVRHAVRNTRAGVVEVRLSQERGLRGLRLNITVEDTGSGMSPQDIDSLSESFQHDTSGVSRLDSSDELDLPLAYQAVAVLGGVMHVHSEIGEGTRVSLSIPVRRAAANDLIDAEPAHDEGTPIGDASVWSSLREAARGGKLRLPFRNHGA